MPASLPLVGRTGGASILFSFWAVKQKPQPIKVAAFILVPAGGIEGNPLQNKDLHDSRQSPPYPGHNTAHPGNCQEVADASISSSRPNLDACPTDEYESPNPKNTQAMPKTSPSVFTAITNDIADEADEKLGDVSPYFIELSEITNAWPKLSSDIRAGIMAMVRAISGSRR